MSAWSAPGATIRPFPAHRADGQPPRRYQAQAHSDAPAAGGAMKYYINFTYF